MKHCQSESLLLRFPVLQEDYNHISGRIRKKRLAHTLGVLETSCELSGLYGGDLLSVLRAAIYHDLFKGIEKAELLALGDGLGYEVSSGVDELPEVAHGPIAALWLQHEGIISDTRILDAVRYHTVGRSGMTLEEKIVYLADAIEPGRDYPGVAALRVLAKESLDQALLTSVTQTLEFVLSNGALMHPKSVEMRNALLQTLGK